jgi:hypothetical protein
MASTATNGFTSLRDRATNVARDLILENNDAPSNPEQLLALCYIRAFTDGIAACAAAAQQQLQAVQS